MSAPAGATTLTQPTCRIQEVLPVDNAISIDCTEIVRMIHNPAASKTSFIEGFVLMTRGCPIHVFRRSQYRRRSMSSL